MSSNISKIDPAGRLSISVIQRRALGLDNGGPVVVTLVGDELRIRSMSSAMSELQAEAAQFLQTEDSSVDAFLAERHTEAESDEHLRVRPSKAKNALPGLQR